MGSVGVLLDEAAFSSGGLGACETLRLKNIVGMRLSVIESFLQGGVVG